MADSLKEKKRSALRLWCGTQYYKARRYVWWMLAGHTFARQRSSTLLPQVQFAHKTPLLRKLVGVELQLQYHKITNLRLAVQKLDGIVLQPGQTFSYWYLIGNPTRRKGYVDGMVLHSGAYRAETGGGLCQLSNLIYWMTLHTPLTVTQRYRHSYDVFPDANRTQPFGSGATCVYNYRDLMVRNDTDQPFQLHVWLTDTHLEGEWRAMHAPLYRYEVYERAHEMRQEYWGQFSRHNMLYRKIFTLHGEEVADEYITENHALMMYRPFLAASATGETPQTAAQP